MIRFLTDEDFTAAILKGVMRRLPDLDIVRVQDVGLRGCRDPLILEFAASENRIVLSHYVATMKLHAAARLVSGKLMPGLLLLPQNIPVARGIEAVVMVAVCSRDDEWNDIIEHLPL